MTWQITRYGSNYKATRPDLEGFTFKGAQAPSWPHAKNRRPPHVEVTHSCLSYVLPTTEACSGDSVEEELDYGWSQYQLLEEIARHLTAREVDQVLRADVIASGTVEGEPTYVVAEVSWTGDTEDVVRADERAKLLRRAGLAALPLVACNAISPESTAMAKLRQVRVWCNGSLLEAAA